MILIKLLVGLVDLANLACGFILLVAFSPLSALASILMDHAHAIANT
jgi:hypothetical protein